MSRRKIEEENIRKIQWSNRSYQITIPISTIRKFGWREKQKVVVEEYGKNKIIISDWPARPGKK